ncbi:MAG TPA: hypothetical protein VEH82_02580 [Acidimicrobiales bacterium]|nr:hypothetical protein [Acidimicrobiales bacterium]
MTSIGLVVGFALTSSARATLIASLLIVGLADNLTDSLSIHLYQESEGLESHEAFVSTVTNFATRLAITATFVALAAFLAGWALVAVATVWGLVVLGAMTISLAHQRHASVGRELVRHFVVAGVVIALSLLIGSVVSGSAT